MVSGRLQTICRNFDVANWKKRRQSECAGEALEGGIEAVSTYMRVSIGYGQ